MAIVFDEIVGNIQPPGEGGDQAPAAGGQGEQPQRLPFEALRKDMHGLDVRMKRLKAD